MRGYAVYVSPSHSPIEFRDDDVVVGHTGCPETRVPIRINASNYEGSETGIPNIVMNNKR